MSINNHKYYNFKIANTSTDEINVEQTDINNNAFLLNSSDWSLSIQKFSLPADSIDSFLINDSSKYAIKMGHMETSLVDATEQLNDLNASYGMPTNDVFNYQTNQDFVEAFNRTSLQCYRNYLYNMGTKNHTTVSDTFLLAVDFEQYLQVYDKTITVANPQMGFTSGILGGVELTLTIGNTDPLLRQPRPFRVYLRNPAGVSCLVYTCANTDINQTLTFKDSSLNSLSSKTDEMSAFQTGDYQPVESFTKFNSGTSAWGDWKLHFEDLDVLHHDLYGLFYMDVSYSLTLYTTQGLPYNVTYVSPQFAPTLAIDQTSNKLQLLLHQSWFYCPCYIRFSQPLAYVLGFDTYNDGSGWYKLKLPQVLLDNTLSPTSFITYAQEISTVYRLTGIRAIEIRSATIPVDGEYDSQSNSPIIMSVDVNVDAAKDRYEYASTSENRFYDLIGDGPLKNINFSVWIIYENGAQVLAKIPPSSSFTMLAKFVRKSILRS
jgi:hypothetical protein